ncbi:PREDICTED: uncharacterized protein LOC109475557 [Branchiostoma belcheri]|uniref:Uncharacterized protein LOC109475557 n=1 Tax=Branchiostoma belcheri TaxID=7741 RepID=A0A6P4YQQ9_BRABE|nr:PREDICTED: uncharacterized protein LOC109475557 [Branchiostoma belcheri]KAI8482011.1 hypothetical protein Bbelb_402570 [Branchiostoma belcheri]
MLLKHLSLERQEFILQSQLNNEEQEMGLLWPMGSPHLDSVSHNNLAPYSLFPSSQTWRSDNNTISYWQAADSSRTWHSSKTFLPNLVLRKACITSGFRCIQLLFQGSDEMMGMQGWSPD